jgi:hypothetical protein
MKHTDAYKALTAAQQTKVERVIRETNCTELIAIAELIAEEWTTQDAVTNIYAEFDWACHQSLI